MVVGRDDVARLRLSRVAVSTVAAPIAVFGTRARGHARAVRGDVGVATHR
jgi:hypothetical protein